MGRQLTQKLHQHYIKALRLTSMITHAILVLPIVALWWITLWQEWTIIPGIIVTALWIISLIAFTFIIPTYRYRSFNYEIFEDELEIRSGIIFHSYVLVPMNRVQHVELEAGPLMRKFNLASIEVVTSAQAHKISGLLRDEAERLKHQIGELAKVDDEHE